MSSEPWILHTKFMYVTTISITIIILLQISFTGVYSVTVSDEIVQLPGQPPVSFKQFAGYITVDKAKQRSLFYYFVEAQSNSSSKPLVLWLNGGPGCSSVGEGAFVEHGPFKPSGRVLVENDYSWNKEANMLYLESPAGVGFSYSVDQSFYASANDVVTAGDNLSFLEKWFEKYPEYKNTEFYITGESYAGHYVPQLANLIVHSKAKINLKGIAIGNPLLDFNTDFNSRGEYLWSHGLISDATYDMFNTMCNYSSIRRQAQSRSMTPTCSRVATQASKEIGRFVNAYDVTLDVCLSNVFSQSLVLDHIQDEETKIDVCVEDEMIVYLNRKDVQTALHARLVGVKNWTPCSEVLSYDMDNLEVPMTPVLISLIKSGIRVLVYSGDQDSVLPLTGTRVVVNGLAKQLGLNTTLPYRAWFNGNQVGGWTQVYGDVLSYATIRGASHEAPFSQPERSIALFRGFLAGKPLPSADEIAQKPKAEIPHL
ncbi:putative carboxypeptidase D [Helianthus annuus]|nr:putative carboxypeptidase D [Helianthus annuus]KAJ0481636.1 putative carboxypeptidase D [Helianthus annuus]KAJ0664070.1 putative carboxypeptidase D [Helianthus annuus]